MTPSSPDVRVLDDPSKVARAAADAIASAFVRAVERTGRFALVLAGGSSPRLVYELLGATRRLDWSRVHVFWGDERCVPPDDPASNYRLAASTLFAHDGPPTHHLHRIPAEHGPAEGSARYDEELATFFGSPTPGAMREPAFDLVLLGMGDDGHTASLFPGGPELTSSAWCAPATAPPGASVAERVTLTLPAIATAVEVVFIVTGGAKRAIVARALSSAAADVPAARATARERVHWLLDRAAAADLPPAKAGSS